MDHVRLGFPTDAIEAVKHLYTQASTQIRLPSGGSTDPIPVERGTIQGDTLSPFLFLLYLEPLLRWLHVGREYNHACADSHDHSDSLVNLKHMHLNNTLSNGALTDDLICLAGSLRNLHIQADKLTRYSNRAAPQVSGSKTKVTGILNGAAALAAAKTGVWGKDPKKHLRTHASFPTKYSSKDNMHTSSSKMTLLPIYLGVELTRPQPDRNLETKTHRPQKFIRLPLADHTHYKYRSHAKHSVCISGHPLRPRPTKRPGQ